MPQVKVTEYKHTVIEVTGDSGEQSRVYQYLEKHYPNIDIKSFTGKGLFNFVLKTDEEKVLENNFVI